MYAYAASACVRACMRAREMMSRSVCACEMRLSACETRRPIQREGRRGARPRARALTARKHLCKGEEEVRVQPLKNRPLLTPKTNAPLTVLSPKDASDRIKKILKKKKKKEKKRNRTAVKRLLFNKYEGFLAASLHAAVARRNCAKAAVTLTDETAKQMSDKRPPDATCLSSAVIPTHVSHSSHSALTVRTEASSSLPRVFSRREIPKVTADVTAPLPLLLLHSSS